jgi:hypothetical protein
MKRNDFILSLKQGFNIDHTLKPISVSRGDQIIFLTLSPLFFPAKTEEVKLFSYNS